MPLNFTGVRVCLVPSCITANQTETGKPRKFTGGSRGSRGLRARLFLIPNPPRSLRPPVKNNLFGVWPRGFG